MQILQVHLHGFLVKLKYHKIKIITIVYLMRMSRMRFLQANVYLLDTVGGGDDVSISGDDGAADTRLYVSPGLQVRHEHVGSGVVLPL